MATRKSQRSIRSDHSPQALVVEASKHVAVLVAAIRIQRRGDLWRVAVFDLVDGLLDVTRMSGGIPADLTRVVDISNVRGTQPSAIAKVLNPMADGLREQGYQWFRITAPADDEAHVYLEAWKVKPKQEGILNRSAASVVT